MKQTRTKLFAMVLLCLMPVGSLQAESLKIDAGGGIAWRAEQKHYLATGRVRIIRGETTSWSDLARAYYEDDPETITRIELEGEVRFVRGTLEITGDSAVVIPDSEEVTLRGEALRLQQDDVVMTARDALRYHGTARRIYALGDALLMRGQQKVSADEIEGVLQRSASGESIKLREAYFRNQVRADNGDSDPGKRLYIEGNDAHYNITNQWLEVCGEARILRGEDVMRGECARYDLAKKSFRFFQKTPENAETGKPDKKSNERVQLLLKTQDQRVPLTDE